MSSPETSPFPDHHRHRLAGGAALLVAAALFVGCGPAGSIDAPTDTQPTLLIAVDGLDWQLLLPAMRQGRVPNLLDVARRGSAARLTTFEPTDSPVIWTSVATGKTKEKHGIERFAQRVDGTLVPVTSNQRLARAFWNILGEAGHPTAVVGWWVTWPAEPIEGWMLAPVTTLGGRTWKGTLYAGTPDQAWPPDLINDLSPVIEKVEREAQQRLQEILPSLPPGAPDWLVEFRRDFGWSYVTDAIFAATAEQLGRDKQPKVMVVYQGLLDVAGHRFWGYTFPPDGAIPHRLDAATASAVGSYLSIALDELDANIGRLRSAMPPDADIIIVSDHGMHHRRVTGPGAPGRSPLVRYNTGAHCNAPDGVWLAAGPSFRAPKPPFRPPGSADELPVLGDADHPAVLDITPTLLHMHHLPVGADMDGRVLLEVLVDGGGSRPLERIDTHEKGPPPARPPAPIPTGADAATIERLRSLGYLDGDD